MIYSHMSSKLWIIRYIFERVETFYHPKRLSISYPMHNKYFSKIVCLIIFLNLIIFRFIKCPLVFCNSNIIIIGLRYSIILRNEMNSKICYDRKSRIFWRNIAKQNGVKQKVNRLYLLYYSTAVLRYGWWCFKDDDVSMYWSIVAIWYHSCKMFYIVLCRSKK